MKITRFYPVLAAVAILVMLLAACGGTPQPASNPTSLPAADTKPPVVPTPVPTAVPTAPEVATFIWTQEFDTLNPLYTNMWFSAVTQQIWNCWAWDFDKLSNPRPVLVTEIPSLENGGVSADGRVITMKLRDDIVWSDGTPITAEDFIFTYDMTMDPKNTVATQAPYDLIEKIEAPDPQTVVITFQEPFVAWLTYLWHGILPAHILQPVFESDGTINDAEWNRSPTVSCGPFNLAEWQSGSFARFVANDKYWLGRPKIDEIFFRFVPDDAAQVAALKAGDGDLGTFISPQDFPALEEGNVKIVSVFSGYNEGIYFNLGEKGHPALQDVNVRKAIALATDRFGLCEDLLLGIVTPAATMWDKTPWNDPSLEPYPYDPEQAKQLLDAAGWQDSNGDGVRDKDGVELVLTYGTTTREIRQQTQAVLQQDLAEVGIKVDLLSAEKSLYFAGYVEGGPCATGEYDMFEYSTIVSAFPDAHDSEWLCSEIPSDESPDGTNWQAVCDPELDALVQQEMTQLDFTARQAIFHKLTKIVFDQVYFLGLWQDDDVWAVGPRLQNVTISGVTAFFDILNWDLK